MNVVNHKRQLQILTGSRHSALAQAVAERMGAEINPTQLTRFANGEVKCQIKESVRGKDLFIFQSHDKPVNDAILEQAIIIDAAKRASARHITAVCPFFGYARQDRKSFGREPITAKLIVDILAVAGAKRLVSVDLHSGQIQGYFNGPFDHLVSLPVLAEYLKNSFGNDFVIVSPDAGRVKLAERYSSRLGTELAIVHKRRTANNKSEALDVIGDVKGKHCVLVDDMIDTAGTLCAAAEQLIGHGATKVSAIATHGIFSEPAEQRLKDSVINTIAVTDSLPLPEGFALDKLKVVSIVDLLADAIMAIFAEGSVSALFDGQNHM